MSLDGASDDDGDGAPPNGRGTNRIENAPVEKGQDGIGSCTVDLVWRGSRWTVELELPDEWQKVLFPWVSVPKEEEAYDIVVRGGTWSGRSQKQCQLSSPIS